MKRFYLAFLCLSSIALFNACNQNKPADQPAEPGEWITSADQIDLSIMDDKDYKCWAIDLWCDGTTISRQYEWGTEQKAGLIDNLWLDAREKHERAS